MGPEKCPFCEQEIYTEATKCFFCGASLDHKSVENRLDILSREEEIKHINRVKIPLAVKIIVFIIMVFTILFLGTSKIKPSLTNSVSAQGTTVSINAEVTLSGSLFIITNNDSFDWTNVELQIISDYIGNSFVTVIPKISKGQKLSISVTDFTKKDGTRFNPYTMKSQGFQIICDTPMKKNISYHAGFKKQYL